MLVLLLLGCARMTRPTHATSLAGLRAPLSGNTTAALVLAGAVAETPAQVRFEVASPLTLVSTGCFETSLETRATVRVPTPEGPYRALSEVDLVGARVADVDLPPRRVGLAPDDACVLTLGSDVLAPFALTLDPEKRELSLRPSQPRQAYEGLAGSGEEVLLLELAREPHADWPLVAVRIQQAGVQLTGPFILATAEAQSKLAESVNGERFDEQGTLAERVELAPGLGAERVVLRWVPGWESQTALGVLGADVWGRFHVTVDLGSNVLVLRRPRGLVSEGSKEQE